MAILHSSELFHAPLEKDLIGRSPHTYVLRQKQGIML